MSRGRHSTKENASAKLKAWRASSRLKAMLLEAGRRGLAIARTKPRCGAKTRFGEPCRGYAMTNNRCRMHGGLTPKGAEWHKPRLPAKGEARGIEKFETKRVAREKRDAKKRQRLAMMTPEQRARHERWHQTHPPGPKSVRAAARARKAQDDWFGGVVRKIDRDRAAEELRRLAIETDNFKNYREGVFG